MERRSILPGVQKATAPMLKQRYGRMMGMNNTGKRGAARQRIREEILAA
jgi:hypothetical protein